METYYEAFLAVYLENAGIDVSSVPYKKFTKEEYRTIILSKNGNLFTLVLNAFTDGKLKMKVNSGNARPEDVINILKQDNNN